MSGREGRGRVDLRAKNWTEIHVYRTKDSVHPWDQEEV